MFLQQSGRPIESKPPLAPAAAHASLRQPDLNIAADAHSPDHSLCPLAPTVGTSEIPSGNAPPAAAPAAAAQQAPPPRPPIGRTASGGNAASMAAAGAYQPKQPAPVATMPAQHGGTRPSPANAQVGLDKIDSSTEAWG